MHKDDPVAIPETASEEEKKFLLHVAQAAIHLQAGTQMAPKKRKEKLEVSPTALQGIAVAPAFGTVTENDRSREVLQEVVR